MSFLKATGVLGAAWCILLEIIWYCVIHLYVQFCRRNNVSHRTTALRPLAEWQAYFQFLKKIDFIVSLMALSPHKELWAVVVPEHFLPLTLPWSCFWASWREGIRVFRAVILYHSQVSGPVSLLSSAQLLEYYLSFWRVCLFSFFRDFSYCKIQDRDIWQKLCVRICFHSIRNFCIVCLIARIRFICSVYGRQTVRWWLFFGGLFLEDF